MNAATQDLQDLLDQLQAGKKEINLPPNETFVIDAPLRVHWGTHFSIKGRHTTIIQQTDGAPILIFELGDTHHFELSGLTCQWENPQTEPSAVGVLLDGGDRSFNGFYDAVFRDLTFLRGYRGISTQFHGPPSASNRIAVWDCHFDNVKGLALGGATLRLAGNIGMPGNTFSRISARQYDQTRFGEMVENKEPQVILSAQRGFFGDRFTLEGSYGQAMYCDTSYGFIGCLRFEWNRLTAPGQSVVYLGGGAYSFGLVDFGCDLVHASPDLKPLPAPIYDGVLLATEATLPTSVVVNNVVTGEIASEAFRLRNDLTRIRFAGIPDSNLWKPTPTDASFLAQPSKDPGKRW